MLRNSFELPLIEKCKIAVWMENFRNEAKVQIAFENEFSKCPPPISVIAEIHSKFMTTGSVLGNTYDKGIFYLNWDKNINEDSDSKERQISVMDKWKNRPKIKIRKFCVNTTIKTEPFTEEIKDHTEISVDISDIDTHLERNSTLKPREVICSYCGHQSIDKQEHLKHYKSHTSSDFFKCFNCNFTCNNTSVFRAHKLQCMSKTFSVVKEEIAMPLNYEKPNVSSIIPGHKQMNNSADSEMAKTDFMHQLKSVKNPSNPNIASYESSTSYWPRPEIHINPEIPISISPKCTKLSNQKVFSCDICDFTTSRKLYLRNHKGIHSTPTDSSVKYDCTVCEQSFRTSQSLRYHVDNFHAEKEYLECPFCDFRQKNKILLQIHIRRHTGEKPYRCSRMGCDFRGHISQELRRHYLKAHSDEVKKS